MAQSLNTNFRVDGDQISNLDANYGPYTSLTDAIYKLFPSSGTILAKTGYTFGIKEGNGVIDYIIKNVDENTSYSTVREDSVNNYSTYTERKVNNTKVVLKYPNGDTIGEFTLNQAANGNIEITIPSQVIVDQVYNAVSQNAQSGTAVAGAISVKANTDDVMQRVTGHTNEIPTLTSTGTLQGSGKTMANVVFFDDVN